MNRFLTCFFLLALLPFLAQAQTTVTAAEILAKINKGEAVSYQNATITGNLDLTKLQNMALKPDKPGTNTYNSKEFISTVTAPISFKNCTFTGNVLAYFNPDNLRDKSLTETGKSLNEVYNTVFNKEVRFEKCVFTAEAAFKYAEFKDQVSFAGSSFKKEALFKYTKFSQSTDFSNTAFEGMAIFKYTKFPQEALFQNAVFRQEASFKYAHFPQGADFSTAQFSGLADFKYANFAGKTDWQGTAFHAGRDIKYTKMKDSPFKDAARKEKVR
ncbi:pentapeptide repeat-containing protein [Rufibacter sp. LB8]|uniref:pentapeptide repeat-containing protein n=1 Tax=Rufibacter sp. LB8 TaxID=2777781 RepID=UPI00178C3079|nr:pentapeptide repeat-containing protein [Rufibacter sp. LB8]